METYSWASRWTRLRPSCCSWVPFSLALDSRSICRRNLGQFQQPDVEIRIWRLIRTTSRDVFPVTDDVASN